MSVDPLVHHLLQLAGALLFASAALHKLRDPAAFRSALAGYRLLPDALVPATARGLPAAELGVAAALLVPALTPVGAAAGAAMLALYAAAVAINLLRGRREIDCGCGGVGGSRPLGASLVARNVLLVLALSALFAPVVERPFSPLDVWVLGLATGTFALLYAAVDVALANAARQREAF